MDTSDQVALTNPEQRPCRTPRPASHGPSAAEGVTMPHTDKPAGNCPAMMQEVSCGSTCRNPQHRS